MGLIWILSAIAIIAVCFYPALSLNPRPRLAVLLVLACAIALTPLLLAPEEKIARFGMALMATRDTVNIASRLESAGEVNKVDISAYTFELVQAFFECEYRRKLAAKGKGEIDMYFVLRERVPIDAPPIAG